MKMLLFQGNNQSEERTSQAARCKDQQWECPRKTVLRATNTLQTCATRRHRCQCQRSHRYSRRCTSRVRSLLRLLCSRKQHLSSKNRCSASVCSLSSSACTRTSLARSLACYSRSTTPSSCICLSTASRSRLKSRKPWPCFRPTRLNRRFPTRRTKPSPQFFSPKIHSFVYDYYKMIQFCRLFLSFFICIDFSHIMY